MFKKEIREGVHTNNLILRQESKKNILKVYKVTGLLYWLIIEFSYKYP